MYGEVQYFFSARICREELEGVGDSLRPDDDGTRDGATALKMAYVSSFAFRRDGELLEVGKPADNRLLVIGSGELVGPIGLIRDRGKMYATTRFTSCLGRRHL